MDELWSRGDAGDLDRFLEAGRREDLAGALFAIEGAPASIVVEDGARLLAWSSRVRERARPDDSPLLQARALQGILSAELGFEGDAEDYHHPRNSLLHEVLTRRRGMPILLSSVWRIVGQGAGLAVAGIGMPGHFIARVGSARSVYVDPFARGKTMSVSDCRAKVDELSGGRLAWRDDFLRESRTDEMLERVLQNLSLGYERTSDAAGRYRTAAFLSALRPESPERKLRKADLADELGAREVAEAEYAEIIEGFPESPESETAAERLAGYERDTLVN
jgi:regulator of sirC expression with transglutaminase-like and TPR domain